MHRIDFVVGQGVAGARLTCFGWSGLIYSLYLGEEVLVAVASASRSSIYTKTGQRLSRQRLQPVSYVKPHLRPAAD
jgi:hypothetical protein